VRFKVDDEGSVSVSGPGLQRPEPPAFSAPDPRRPGAAKRLPGPAGRQPKRACPNGINVVDVDDAPSSRLEEEQSWLWALYLAGLPYDPFHLGRLGGRVPVQHDRASGLYGSNIARMVRSPPARQRMPLLIVLVTRTIRQAEDAFVLTMDPTGECGACIHSEVLMEYPFLVVPGATLILRDASFFRAAGGTTLIVTLRSLVTVCSATLSSQQKRLVDACPRVKGPQEVRVKKQERLEPDGMDPPVGMVSAAVTPTD